MMQFAYIKNRSLLMVFCLLLVSCEGVWVQDPIDPRIPKYTEEGNEVAGALINDEVWESVVETGLFYQLNYPSIFSWPDHDSLVIIFCGNINNEVSNIEFHLSGLNIDSLKQLTKLGGQTIKLDGKRNVGFYIDDYSANIYDNKGVGQVYFRYVSFQQAYTKITLSGTFAFTTQNMEGETINVTSGRFDYVIHDEINIMGE